MNQTERLKEIFIKNENKGIAIAITGSWGIGKTFFWNEFIKERIKQEKREREKYYYKATLIDKKAVFDKRYSYVSLFGIETLSDLKTKIYTQLSGHHFSEKEQPKFEVPRWVKAIASGLKEEKVSQLGFSSSMRFFDSMLFAQVKDAIICFDDFERMSNKLDIKDVMGLANQLKLEKNCQVILILDEDKTEDKNKEKYAEYKEKLIDENIKITSVEPLIRDKAKEVQMDKLLIDLMVKFADELEIHNFRFFQKVIRLYREFREELPMEVADSTKEIILIRVLQGYFIADFGINFEFSWGDIKLILEENQKGWSERKIKTYEALKSLSYYFIYEDQWLIQYKKRFDQKGEMDIHALKELAQSEFISEKNNQIRDELDQLMFQWRNLEAEDGFCKKLLDLSIKRIGYENLENLDFYCELLFELGSETFSLELEANTKVWILEQYHLYGASFVDEQFSFGFKENNRFHKYIKSIQDELPDQGLPPLIEIVYRYVVHNGWNTETDSRVLQIATKEDWKKLIFIDIHDDKRFAEFNIFQILKKILIQQIDIKLQQNIRDFIFEILSEKAKNSEFERRKNIEYVMKRLKE